MSFFFFLIVLEPSFWHFFSLIDLDYHITFYNIYDHRWVSLSYEPDDMQEKLFICIKKSENDLLIEKIEVLMKMMNRESRTWWKFIIQFITRFFERSFSDFFIQMKIFSCMSSGSYENDTQRWSYESDLSRERSAQTSFWSSLRPLNSLFSSSPRFPRSRVVVELGWIRAINLVRARALS